MNKFKALQPSLINTSELANCRDFLELSRFLTQKQVFGEVRMAMRIFGVSVQFTQWIKNGVGQLSINTAKQMILNYNAALEIAYANIDK